MAAHLDEPLPQLRVDQSTVLVLDEDPDERYVLRRELERLGLDVVESQSLHDALERLSERPGIDAVVCELVLPDHDGMFTVDTLRAAQTSLPIVVYTHAEDDLRRVGMRQGATRVIGKDRAPKEVATEVVSALRYDEAAATVVPAPDDDLPATGLFRDSATTLVQELAVATAIPTWFVARPGGTTWWLQACEDPVLGLEAGIELPYADTFVCRLVQSFGLVVSDDTAIDPAVPTPPAGVSLPMRAVVGIPVSTEFEGLHGVIVGLGAEPYVGTPPLGALMPWFRTCGLLLAGHLAASQEVKRLERRLEIADRASQVDLLTGLGNRRAWERTLAAEQQRCSRYGHRAAVAVVDLNGLKRINDLSGHKAGDRLLRMAAASLRGTLRRTDSAFRVGGDEFVLVLPEATDDVIDRFSDRLQTTFAISGISAATGVAHMRADETIYDAHRRADAAMYEQKAIHHGRSSAAS